MTRPADVPEDIWQAAQEVMMESRLFMIATDDFDEHATIIARTLIATKFTAYLEIAEMADAYADVEDVSAIHAATDESNHYHRVAETTLRAFSESIRTRSTP